MTDNIVNLNKARKAKARADKKTKAAENRIKFGRRKTDKIKSDFEKRKFDDHIDSHKRDDD